MSKPDPDLLKLQLDLALSRHDAAICGLFHLFEFPPGQEEEFMRVIESWRELRRFFRAAPGVDAGAQVRKWQKWSEEHGEMTAPRVSGTGRVH